MNLLGWYHCQLVGYQANGHVKLLYKDSATEIVDLRSVEWKFARKSAKRYLPLDSIPPTHPLKKVREASLKPKKFHSQSRSVVAADDITIISSTQNDHQTALTKIDQSCSDIGLMVRPDKINVCLWYLTVGNTSTRLNLFYNQAILVTSLLPLLNIWVKLLVHIHGVQDLCRLETS